MNTGRISQFEEDLHLITRDNGKNRGRIGDEANALSIPVAGYLEAENIPVLLSCPYQIRYCELGHRHNEAYGRW